MQNPQSCEEADECSITVIFAAARDDPEGDGIVLQAILFAS